MSDDRNSVLSMYADSKHSPEVAFMSLRKYDRTCSWYIASKSEQHGDCESTHKMTNGSQKQCIHVCFLLNLDNFLHGIAHMQQNIECRTNYYISQSNKSNSASMETLSLPEMKDLGSNTKQGVVAM